MSTCFSAMDTTPSFFNGNPVKLQDLCRMCASPCVKSVPIFGSEGLANELAAKFSSYLPVKISEADTLPLQLCYECTNLLIQWDAAVLVATAADKKLRALQWRQQQSQTTLQKTRKTPLSLELGKQQKVTAMNSMESISCSICNKSGMEFRELVDHLKSHDMSNEWQKKSDDNDAVIIVRKKKKSTCTKLSLPEEVDGDSSSGLELSKGKQPTKRKLRSKKNSETESQSSSGIRGRLRTKRWKGASQQDKKNLSNVAEGGSGDPVVTSSTNSKVSEQLNGEDILSPSLPVSGENPKQREAIKDSPSNLSVKPKVRIISAESINQSLEERAKANRNVNLEVGSNGTFVPAVGPFSASCNSILKPRMPDATPKSFPPTKIIMSGGIVKDVKGEIKARFLRLPDGRIIRLLQSPTRPSQKSSALMYASTPIQRAVPKSVFSKLVSKSALNEEENQVKQVPSQDSTDTTRTSHDCPVSEPSENDNGVDEKESEALPSHGEKVTLSNSRIISFNIQPGPKNSVNRYTCAYCGKRNLLQDNLHMHAQTHCPKETETEQNVPLP